MAQIGAVFVFCSSCKILYFASSVHPKNATEKAFKSNGWIQASGSGFWIQDPGF